jgi:putative lysine transport system permease protein
LALGKNIEYQKKDNALVHVGKLTVKGLCSGYSLVVRGTPMMVQAMIFKYACQAAGVNWNTILPEVDVFDGWLVAGLIVISFNTAAYMCEVVRSGINGVSKGEIEGALSLGMTRFQTDMSITLPQALRNAIPTIGNEWIVNIKDSSVLNVIGVSELYFQSGQAANKYYLFMAAYLIVAIIYLILTLATTGILKLVERKADGKPPLFPFSHYQVKKETN